MPDRIDRKSELVPAAVVARLVARVRALVEARDGGNVSAAARRTGVKQPQLSKLLAGKVDSPTIDTVVLLARGYGVSFDDLLGAPAAEERVPPAFVAAVADVRRAVEAAAASVSALERKAAAFRAPPAGVVRDAEEGEMITEAKGTRLKGAPAAPTATRRRA